MRSAAAITLALAGLCGLGALACSSEKFVTAPRPSDAGLDAESSAPILVDASLDGATDADRDARPLVEGGPGWLPCGISTCRAPEETCCVSDLDTGTLSVFLAAPPTRGRCVAAGACPAPERSFGCYDVTSCAARSGGADAVCCVTNDGSSLFTSTYCATHATCDSSGPRDILCDVAAPNCPPNYPNCSHDITAPFSADSFPICRP